MSGKCKSQTIEEIVKKPKLDDEISDKLSDTRRIPKEVWQEIFGSFSLKEIKLTVARVCKHFYEISNDCVQEININGKIFTSEDHHFEMFDAIPNFKFLNTIKIGDGIEPDFGKEVEYFLMHALKICPRLKYIDMSKCQAELSIGFLNQISKHGQNLYGLELNFGNCDTSNVLSPFKNGLKSLKHLGLTYLFDDYNDSYNKENLLSLADNCKELDSIQLLYGDVGVDTVCELIHLKKNELKHFKFGIEGIENKWLHDLMECPKLESLIIGSMLNTKSGFQTISKLKNLKKLQLGFKYDHLQQEFETDDPKIQKFMGNDLIQILSNGKFENLKELYIYGIDDSIDEILVRAALVCPSLQYLELECIMDNRKDFSDNIIRDNIIRVLLDNLPELMEVKFEWLLDQNETNPRDNPIFVKTQFEEIVGRCKNRFQVEIGENYDYVKIVREI